MPNINCFVENESKFGCLVVFEKPPSLFSHAKTRMTPRMMHPREWKKRWNLPQFDEMEDEDMTAMDDIMQVRCRAVIYRHLGS